MCFILIALHETESKEQHLVIVVRNPKEVRIQSAYLLVFKCDFSLTCYPSLLIEYS